MGTQRRAMIEQLEKVSPGGGKYRDVLGRVCFCKKNRHLVVFPLKTVPLLPNKNNNHY